MIKKQNRRPFSAGWSRYLYEGEWIEERIKEAVVSDTHISIDIYSQGEDGNEEIVTVAGSSSDGRIFSGTYRYHRNTYPPGRIRFTKEQCAVGYKFNGCWISDDGLQDKWVIELE